MMANDFDDDGGEPLLELPAPHGAKPKPMAIGVPDLDLGRRPTISFDDDEPAGPALEVAAIPPKLTSRPAPARSAPSPGRSQAVADARGSGGGAMFDDDDMLGGGGGTGLSLELDVPEAPPKPQRRVDSIAPSGPPASRASHGPNLAHFKAGPTGGSVRPVAVDAPPMEAIEARLLGNFGDPPKSWWQTPLYAWKVRNRLIELRQALALRRKDALRAQAQTQAALVALGQRARATAEQAPSYGRTLEGLKSAEALLRSRDGALMADMDAHNKKLAVLDQRTRQLETELSTAQAAERKVAAELAEVQALAQRAEAKLKRIEGELRGAGAPRDPRRGGG